MLVRGSDGRIFGSGFRGTKCVGAVVIIIIVVVVNDWLFWVTGVVGVSTRETVNVEVTAN